MSKPMPPEENELAGRQTNRCQDGLFSRQTMIGALIGAVTVVLAWGALGSFTSVPTVRPEKGAIEVKYMVQTSPTTAEGGKLDDVSSIEFFPHDLVVKRRDHRGHVDFGEQTREFSWKPQPESPAASTGH